MKLNLTKDQETQICWIIGEWYLMWKNSIANYEDKTHNLGAAKDLLKTIICEWDNIENDC